MVLFLIFSPEYTLVNLIDIVFYFGFLYLVVFLFLYIVKGKFFDGLVYSFRKFNHVMFKKGDYLEGWKEKPLPSEGVKPGFYSAVKFQSLALLSLLMILLAVYYL